MADLPFADLLGRVVTLPVRRLGPPGAFLAVDPEDPSPNAKALLLPGSEMPEGTKEGDEIEVFVYLDSEDRAFIDWGLQKELLVPLAEQTREVHVGDRHPIGLYIDDSGRLAGTMRVTEMLKDKGEFELDEWVANEAWRKENGIQCSQFLADLIVPSFTLATNSHSAYSAVAPPSAGAGRGKSRAEPRLTAHGTCAARVGRVRALPSFSITASLAVATLAIGTLVGALVSRQVMMSARSPGGPGAEGAAFALSLGAVALLVAALDPTKRGGAAAAFATVAWVPFLVHGAWTRLHDVIGLGFAYQGLNVEGLLLTLLVLPLAPLGAALLVRVRRVAIGATAAAGLLCLLGVVRFKPDPFAFVSAAKPVATLDVGAPVAFPGGVLTERRTGTTSYPADEMNPAGTVPECTFFVASRRVDAWFSGCAKYEVLHDEATDLVLVGSADELHQYGRPGLVLRWSTGERVTPRWVDLHDSLAPPAVWLVSSGGGAVLALAALLLAAVLRRRAAAHPRDPVPAPHEGRVASLQTFAVSCVVLTSAELAVAALERLVF